LLFAKFYFFGAQHSTNSCCMWPDARRPLKFSLKKG
jgi:hypothetical protein